MTRIQTAVVAVVALLILPLIFGAHALVQARHRECYQAGTVGPVGVHTSTVCYSRHIVEGGD